jgi:signal transduction histidine kinase
LCWNTESPTRWPDYPTSVRDCWLSLDGELPNTGLLRQPYGREAPATDIVSESAAGAETAADNPRPAPRTWVLWAVAVTSTGVVTGSLVLALASDQLDFRALRAFLIGWIVIPYVVSGILAWWRRPASRLGPLMLATGFAMALSPLQWSDQPALNSIGNLFDMLPAAMFLHLFLAFPIGRLAARPERAVVITCYATVLVPQFVKIMFGANPASIFVVVPRPAIGNMIERIQLSLVAALLLAGAALVYVRRRRTGLARRRPAALVVDAFAVALVMLAVLYLAGLGSWPGFETIRLITFATLGLAPVAFLFALLDTRLARGEVAGLLVDLRSNPTMELQAPLAHALRDPSVQLAYWLPRSGSWADQNGEPMTLPQADQRRCVRVIYRGKEPMAALVFDRSLEDEHELLDAVAAAAGIALENGRLRAELRARLQELERSRVRVLEAGRLERQRLERNLHDGAQQRLVALSLELGLLEQGVAGDPELQDRLDRAKTEVTASLEELRDVARGIYPAVLSSHGLGVALESLGARAAVPVRLDLDLDGRVPEAVEVAVYYVVSEALTNMGKHAQASSGSVSVQCSGGQMILDVSDDGVGGADPSTGSGLSGLADRVEALGGEFSVISPPAGGTKILAEIPCQ